MDGTQASVGAVSDWFATAVAGDTVICVHAARNLLTAGKTYTIARFVGQPDMISDFGPYPVGLMVVDNDRWVFDPRYFTYE